MRKLRPRRSSHSRKWFLYTLRKEARANKRQYSGCAGSCNAQRRCSCRNRSPWTALAWFPRPVLEAKSTQHLKIKKRWPPLEGFPLAKALASPSSFYFCIFTCKRPWWCLVSRGETGYFIFRLVFLRPHRKKGRPRRMSHFPGT